MGQRSVRQHKGTDKSRISSDNQLKVTKINKLLIVPRTVNSHKDIRSLNTIKGIKVS